MGSGARSAWGAKSQKLPRGPHSLSREEVARNQRMRLIEAMLSAAGEKGYLETTVADVIARAGVSRKAFYEHFPNKEECFLETYDTVVTEDLARLTGATGPLSGTRQDLDTLLHVMFEHAAANPLAIQLALIEIGGLKTAGVPRREGHMAILETSLKEALAIPTDSAPGPDPVLRAIVGGVNDVLHTWVRRGARGQVAKLEGGLSAWISSYYPAQAAASIPQKSFAQRATLGGRAPGTLSPPSPGSTRRGLRGVNRGSHSYVVHNQRERVLDAVANLSAAKGYAGVTVRDIAEHAAISLDAFYEHFADKQDAFHVAHQVGHGRSLAVVERAYRDAPDWRRAIRAALAALFEFLACEPNFAHLTLVDALVANPPSAERARQGMQAYAYMLEPGLAEARPGKHLELAIEAIVGGIFELCLTYALQRRVEELPSLLASATYFSLAPFIGAEEAVQVALEG